MSGWADRGHQLADAPPTRCQTATTEQTDHQVLDQLRQHRADAQRSPEQLRRAAFLTTGPKPQGWRVLS